MTGVGKQRERVNLPANHRLNRDESDIERDADGKRTIEFGWLVRVSGFDHARRNVPSSFVPGATVLNTVPYCFTFVCRSSNRRSDSPDATTIS